MKHSSIRELFDYWNARRAGREAPERADIEPAALRRVLADTFILSFEPRAGHPFRIAGTRVCALFGRELKGEAFLDLWSTDGRREMRSLLAVVANETVGLVASAAGDGLGRAPLDLELLLLPLRHHGRTDARVLGALVPGEPPIWIGGCALRDLTVGMHRYVGQGYVGQAINQAHPAAASAHGGRTLGRLRHGFVVLDGGQS
jgi:hypothetical protein